MSFNRSTTKVIAAWSFSRWNTWVKCPRKAYYKFVERRKEPSGPAADRGDWVHKRAEAFLRKQEKALPEELHKHSKMFQRLRELKAKPEVELALTSAWTQTEWFAKDTWCRVKIDVLAFKGKLAGVTDWKTGRFKPGSPSYDLQLHLYGTGVLSGYPKVEEVEARLVFTDHPKQKPVVKVYHREELREMQQGWEERVRPMMADRRFAPLPSHDCTYCHFSKRNKGPCKF